MASTDDAETAPAARLEISASRQFPGWLREQGCALAFTTYQAGKLFLIGTNAAGQLSVFERTFNRSMGLAAHGGTLWLSSLYQVWRMTNVLSHGETHQDYDRLYVPRLGYTTGDIDIHDMAVDADGRLIFVSTLFSCLATVSESHSFQPLWKPDFISRLAAEDRCHLNGLAMREGQPAFVTAVSQTDVADGWRDHRRDGGVLVDVGTSEIVTTGLSMPHSPRWHDGRVWLCNAGTGEFGYVLPDDGRFEPVAFCPGFLRGLTIAGNHAIVGLSRPRDEKLFNGLRLQDRLEEEDVSPRCGLQVIDLATGDAVHWLNIEGAVQELYDVAVLPGVRRPMALGFVSDEIRRFLTIDDAAFVADTAGEHDDNE